MTIRLRHMPALVPLLIHAMGTRAILVAQHPAHQHPAHQQATPVDGVWRFVDEVDRRSDGSLVETGPALGYTGILIFTGSGYMSSTIIPKGRTWRREAVTPLELRETFEGASAHAGRYEVDSAKHVVRIENAVSLDPGDEGRWDVVQYRVRGDTLELSGPWTYKGEKLTFTVRLRRLE